MVPVGPRIVFKDDRDSSIQRGCHLYGGHFRPEISKIFHTVAQTAPHNIGVVIFSEGHRPPRKLGERDLHTELRAIDVSLNTIFADPMASEEDILSNRRERGKEWADRIRRALGPDYTVVLHGEGYNLHIHIELDPR